MKNWRVEVYIGGNTYFLCELTMNSKGLFLSDIEEEATLYSAEQLGDVVNSVMQTFPDTEGIELGIMDEDE